MIFKRLGEQDKSNLVCPRDLSECSSSAITIDIYLLDPGVFKEYGTENVGGIGRQRPAWR
jgi:hypothetical protein